MSVVFSNVPLFGTHNLNTISLAVIFASAYALCGLGLAVYRLYVSPLAKFPGPKLAAVTHWYEAYYDLFANGGGGQFTWEVKRMHEKYGPIVRINPSELHIDDVDFYNEVYCASQPSKPMDKSGKFKYRFGIPEATFSTTHAEQHRERRAALAPFFSKTRIRALNGKLSEIVDRISYRLSTEYAGTGRVISVSAMWSSMALDVITDLAYNNCAHCADAPDFQSPLSEGMQNLAWAAHWNAHFNILVHMINWVPDRMLGTLVPPFEPILALRAVSQGPELRGPGANGAVTENPRSDQGHTFRRANQGL